MSRGNRLAVYLTIIWALFIMSFYYVNRVLDHAASLSYQAVEADK